MRRPIEQLTLIEMRTSLSMSNVHRQKRTHKLKQKGSTDSLDTFAHN